jgi:hypothetical protein
MSGERRDDTCANLQGDGCYGFSGPTESVVERFEPIKLLPNRIRNPLRPCPDDDLDIIREEPPHAPLPKPAGARPHGGGVSLGLAGPLLRRPVSKEDHRTDHFVAPLRLVHKLELQLRDVFGWHPRGSPALSIQAGDL